MSPIIAECQEIFNSIFDKNALLESPFNFKILVYFLETECYNSKEVMDMLCPKCGKEMEAGFLQCSYDSSITWVSKLLPMGVGYWKQDAQIISGQLGVGVTAVPAQICKQCQIVVSDYSQVEKSV